MSDKSLFWTRIGALAGIAAVVVTVAQCSISQSASKAQPSVQAPGPAMSAQVQSAAAPPPDRAALSVPQAAEPQAEPRPSVAIRSSPPPAQITPPAHRAATAAPREDPPAEFKPVREPVALKLENRGQ